MIVCGLGLCLTGIVVYSLCKAASEIDREAERILTDEIDRKKRINARLKELGLEGYSWDIDEVDDEVIHSILSERKNR
jgi:hypothetical protein